MKITPKTFVIIEYTLRLPDGSYVKGEGSPASLNFVVGYNQILPSLEQRLLGLSAGDARELTIPASEAFGLRDQNLVHRKHFSDFPEGRSLQIGKWVVARNEATHAQYSYYVQNKSDDWVDLDFNHPLAGKDLHYHVRVMLVRPVTEEEIDDLRPCEVGSDDESPQGE